MNQQLQIDQKFIILLFITLPLHVSTLLRHLLGARSQYPLSYVNVVLVIHFKTLLMFCCQYLRGLEL